VAIAAHDLSMAGRRPRYSAGPALRLVGPDERAAVQPCAVRAGAGRPVGRRQGSRAAQGAWTARPVPRRGLPARVRRRLAGAVVAVALAAAWVLLGGASGAGAGAAPAPPAVVVVAPGDTVWTLAGAQVPAGESRQAYVAEVLERNDLGGAPLQPGTVLRLPVR